MKENVSAKIMQITSMLIFGTIGLFVRAIPLSSGEIALYRSVLAIAAVGVFLLISRRKIDIKSIGRELILLAISGIAMALNWVFLFEAYNYTSISLATVSYYFAPVVVILLSPILFKEKMGTKKWVCSIAATVGLILIIGVSVGAGENHLVGILFGLTAALLYATVILLNKAIRRVGGIERTFLQFVSSLLVLVPYVLLTDGINVTSLDTKEIFMLLIVGLVHTGVTYCLYFSSLGKLSGQSAALLAYVDPLVAVLASVFILNESMTVWQIVGALLVLGFTAINEIELKRIQR